MQDFSKPSIFLSKILLELLKHLSYLKKFFRNPSEFNLYIFIAGATQTPTLIPYPNYEINRIRNNETNFQNKIVSVVRMNVDACDRMWFVDMGVIDITGANRQATRPRLLIYDLRTNRQIRSYTFTDNEITLGLTMFGGSIAVDVSASNCNRAFAYIPDFQAYRLVVYSYETNSAWRIRHPYFYFDPFATPFNVDGEVFLWVDGILGATLSGVQNDGYRTLYFAGLASNYQFSVSTRYLQDRNLAANTTVLLEAYRFLGTRGPNMQTTAHMMDPDTGIDFYALPNRNAIGCWNSNLFPNNYSPDTNVILANDDVTMIFPIDIIVDDSDNVWFLTDRLAVSLSRGLNANDVNMRLFSANIRDAVRGTACDPEGGDNLSSRFGSNSGNNEEKKYPSLAEVLKAGVPRTTAKSLANYGRKNQYLTESGAGL